MARLRLNMLVNGARCKSVEDVVEHFNVLDLLEHLERGYLTKWLKSIDMEDLAKEVENLANKNRYEKLEGLCKIFGVEVDENVLKEEALVYELQNSIDAGEDPYKRAREVLEKIDIKIDNNKSKYVFKKLKIKVGFSLDEEKFENFIKRKNKIVKNSFRGIGNIDKSYYLRESLILSIESLVNIFKTPMQLQLDLANDEILKIGLFIDYKSKKKLRIGYRMDNKEIIKTIRDFEEKINNELEKNLYIFIDLGNNITKEDFFIKTDFSEEFIKVDYYLKIEEIPREEIAIPDFVIEKLITKMFGGR